VAIIYIITNSVNQKQYVGKTKNTCDQRLVGHKSSARRGYQTRLARAIRKYGEASFTIEILEDTTEDQLDDRERYFIKTIKPEYNMTSGGDGGAQTSPEVRKRLSDCAKKYIGDKNGFFGKTHTAEAKEKMAASRRGRSTSDEVKRKISKTLTGYKFPPIKDETKAKMKDAWVKRRKIGVSNETKAKMSAARKGRIYKFISPSGNEFITNHAGNFCIENGLAYSSVVGCLKKGLPLDGRNRGWSVFLEPSLS
jgi:group I intron endonuclease